MLVEEEKVALVADGQGNPPEVETGTLWLGNVANEDVLFHVPVTDPLPFGKPVVLQWAPLMVAVAVRQPCGTFSVVVVPSPEIQTCQVQPVGTLREALKAIPKMLPEHPEKATLSAFTQTGSGGVQLAEPDGGVNFTVVVQVTVAPPSTNFTLPDAVSWVPVGEIHAAYAAWMPRPNTVAITGMAT